jgi:hypothetical protein
MQVSKAIVVTLDIVNLRAKSRLYRSCGKFVQKSYDYTARLEARNFIECENSNVKLLALIQSSLDTLCELSK